jgi:hypothetical protein
MLSRVDLVRIDVSEETSVLTRATRCNILEDGIIQCYQTIYTNKIRAQMKISHGWCHICILF